MTAKGLLADRLARDDVIGLLEIARVNLAGREKAFYFDRARVLGPQHERGAGLVRLLGFLVFVFIVLRLNGSRRFSAK